MVHYLLQYKKPLIILYCLLVIAAGFYLRIPKHADWIDEIKFFEIVRIYDKVGMIDGIKQTHGREAIPAVICHAIGLDEPHEIRWLFACSGVGMILIPLVLFKGFKVYAPLMLFVAVHPLFFYWSAFARPYIPAAFFVMLAWKWPLFMIPAVFTSPTAIVGVNLFKRKWVPFYIVLFLVTVIYYKSMPLSESGHFTKQFLLNARRIYVVPLVTLVLYICSIDFNRLAGLQFSAKRLVKDFRHRLRHK